MLWHVRASRELVIRNALVYDGTGAPPIAADVAVRGDRIAATGAPRSLGAEPADVLDAAGLALAPGFIDVHTHDDFAADLMREFGLPAQSRPSRAGRARASTAPSRACSTRAPTKIRTARRTGSRTCS
jgi:predicted amidohydrolase YtcJ